MKQHFLNINFVREDVLIAFGPELAHYNITRRVRGMVADRHRKKSLRNEKRN